MFKISTLTTIFIVGLWWGCTSSQDTPSPSTPLDSNFQNGTEGWQAELTDYFVVQESLVEFQAKHSSIPNLSNRKGFMLSSHNRSDDLFMFLKKKLTDLPPNKTYKVTFEVELASKYPANSFGIGGSPGKSVFLKAGASPNEPKKIKDANNFYKLSWDKGYQSQTGKDVVGLGDVSTPGDKEIYQIISRNSLQKPMQATTNAQGELWIVVGTDSGFEGITTLYYTRIKINLL
ncbi:MAG: hypothetical protein ACK4GN_08410 [Runella sp.]